MEQFLQTAGLKIRDIPYRGDPPVVTDLLGGQIDVAALVIGVANNPKLRVLGVFSSERNPGMPDVPTVKEQGFDVSPGSFGGLFAPLDTPKDVLAKLASACEGAAKDDAMRRLRSEPRSRRRIISTPRPSSAICWPTSPRKRR